jgi:hypothetical protein
MTGVGTVGNTGIQNLYNQILQQSSVLAPTTLAAKAETSAETTESNGNPKGVSGLLDQIRSAVSQALASLDKTSSSQTVVDTIRSAIDSTLKANGIDTSAGIARPHHRHEAKKNQDAFQQMIDQLLQQNGFDPNKIRADLQAQSGSSSSAGGSAIAIVLISALPVAGGVDAQA